MSALKKVLLAAAVIGLYSFPALADIGPEYGSMVQITFSEPCYNPNYKTDPVISQDGNWIAFKTAVTIWIVPSAGGEAKLLYNGEARTIESNERYSMGALRFTPDGKEIVFMEEVDVYDTRTSTVTSAVNTIKAVNIETKAVRVVLENANWVQFTKDGRYISYVTNDPKAYTDVLQADHNGVMTIYDTQTGEKRFLTNENLSRGTLKYLSPTISLDRKWVYFNEMDSSTGNVVSQLYRMPFEGGDKEQLTFFENVKFGYCRNMNISPDGKWVLFDYCFDVLVYNTETGEVYRYFPGTSTTSPNGVPNDTGWETSPSWMPDGTSFVYNLLGQGRKGNTSVTEDGTIVVNGSEIFICKFDTAKYPMADVQTIVQSENPEGFALLSNYPNPFNPTTTIEYSITKPGLTNLSIYNIAGQKVCDLVSGYTAPGKHSVVWNGRDNNGTPVSSGIFISRLESRDIVVSNRMMLVK